MCGIVGIIGTPQAAQESYLGLLMLQHRGQDSAGILSFDETSHRFYLEKNLGHVTAALTKEQLETLPGNMAIAHTRYSTIGQITKEDIQPMVMNYPYGIGMVHNGNILNTQELKDELFNTNKRLTMTNNDLEIMMNILANELSQKEQELNLQCLKSSVEAILEKAIGGYSVISLLANYGMLLFKDPSGLRPLVMGEKIVDGKIAYAAASESNALEFLGYEKITELSAGEIIFITNLGQVHRLSKSQLNNSSPCMFEWIYFANADSSPWNKNVYSMRLKFGEILGASLKQQNHSYDIIVPVPDTARPSAITMSEKMGIPYREVLIKNRYSQRTFILNKQCDRERMIKLKLNVVKEEVQGKNVLLVDDSIVRGTTSKRIIELLKQNGAKKVSLASTCPPIIQPCFYGIDFPDQNELIANRKNTQEIAQLIGADHLYFLSIDQLKMAFGQTKTCMACLDGNYPTTTHNAQTMIETRIRYEEASIPRFS